MKQTLMNFTFSVARLGLVLVGTSVAAAGEPPASYQVLKSFTHLGSNPTGLIEASDGLLYGTFMDGGQKWEGLVFKIKEDGSGYEVVHSFTGYMAGEDGSWPQGVVEGSDGALYGTTQRGGRPADFLHETGGGTIFKVNKDGSGYAVLRRFPAAEGDGLEPWAGLVQGRDGALYGTTLEGGAKNLGTVFKLNKDGSGYEVLHNFAGSEADGCRPMAGLLVGSDGALYGTTDAGGNSQGHNGTVFKLNHDGSGYKVLHSFMSSPGDGRSPRSNLIQGRDGALYGTTLNGGTNDAGTVFTLNGDGGGYRVLHSFTGSAESKPDPDGLTEGVFNGVPTRFSSGGEGSGPNGLVQGKDGALYGTVENGGKNSGGTAFRLAISGEFTLLHNFPATQEDGKNPSVPMVEGSDGTLYGMTKVTQGNNFASLFKFSASADTP